MKIKVRGITGIPFFISRWAGFLDAKRGAIDPAKATGRYISKKEAAFRAFVYSSYQDTERRLKPLFVESSKLVEEYHVIQGSLGQPDEPIVGKTASMRARNAAKVGAIKPMLLERKKAVLVRLGEIQEEIDTQVAKNAVEEKLASALTERRVEAYLLGASLAKHISAGDVSFAVPKTTEEGAFATRHSENSRKRTEILSSFEKEERQWN